MNEQLTDVASMSNWILEHTWRFPMACYQDSVSIPFEGTEISVPVLYQDALRIQFGEHYMTPYRGGGGHDYPCYQRFESQMKLLLGEYYPLLQYQASSNDLTPGSRHQENGFRKIVQEFFYLVRNIHIQLLSAINSGDHATGRTLLESCQTTAFQIGTLLEQRKGEGLETVRRLEEYCELIWQIHEFLDKGQISTATSYVSDANQLLDQIEALTRQEILSRKEIVFFPFCASGWSSFDAIWKQATADPCCDVYVVPIPCYYRNIDGTFRQERYETETYPDYVPITDYRNYNFESRHPDVIFIHNPYDEYNLTTSVDPRFYARNLRQFTELLVYTPYFTVEDFTPDDIRSVKNMSHYVSMPGVVLPDRVLVQTEQMRQMYIDHLTEFAGKDTRSLWEEHIVVYNHYTPEYPG